MNETKSTTSPVVGPIQEYPGGPEICFASPNDVIIWIEDQRRALTTILNAAIGVQGDFGAVAASWQRHLDDIASVASALISVGAAAGRDLVELRRLFDSLVHSDANFVFLSVRDPRVAGALAEMRDDSPALQFAGILLEADRSDLVVDALSRGQLSTVHAVVAIRKSAAINAITRSQRLRDEISKRAEELNEAFLETKRLNTSVESAVKLAEAAASHATTCVTRQEGIIQTFDAKVKSANNHVDALQKTLDETIRLSSSEAYWAERARKAGGRESKWLIALLALIIGPLIIVVWNWNLVLSFVYLVAEKGHLTVGVVFVFPGIMFLLLVRFLLRQQQRHAHIADDAEFRRSLIVTHLSLVANGKILADHDRVLVLQAIFRSITPTSEAEASPATMIEALSKNITSNSKPN